MSGGDGTRGAVARSGAGGRPHARAEPQIANDGHYAGLGLRELKAWLADLLGSLAPPGASFAVRLVSAREMARLNRVYRRRDRPTDVLSFPGEETPEGRHLGDVAIAVPVARRQAARAGHDLGRELRLLLLHGVLHCLGYDHETDDGAMDRRERRLRARWIAPPAGASGGAKRARR